MFLFDARPIDLPVGTQGLDLPRLNVVQRLNVFLASVQVEAEPMRIFIETRKMGPTSGAGKVLKCEHVMGAKPGGWAYTVAMGRAHTVEDVDSAMIEEVD